MALAARQRALRRHKQRQTRASARKQLVRGVGATGSLNDLASLANQAARDGDEYNGALKRLLAFKTQSRKRSDKNQAKFAWIEENKRMKKEAAGLWKDLERYSKTFNRESHLGDAEYTTMKKELFLEIQAIQNLVADFVNVVEANKTVGSNQGQQYEIASILSEYNSTQELIQKQLDEELAATATEVRTARASVYHSLRKKCHSDGYDEGITSDDTDVDVFEIINTIPLVNRMDPSAVFDVSQRLLAAYEKYKGDVKQLKSAISGMYIEQRSNAPKLARQSHNNENKDNNIATSSVSGEAEAKTKAKDTNHGSTFLFNNWSTKSHSLFLKIYKETVQRGKSKSELYKRYRMSNTTFDESPKSLEDLQDHLQKYEKYRFTRKEIREKKITWQRLLKEEVSHFRHMCAENVKQIEANERKQEIIRAQNAKTAGLHEEFQRLKKIYDKKQEEKEAQRMEQQRLQDAHDEMLRKKADALAKRNKELATLYKQQKKMKQQDYEMQLKRAQEEQEQARLEMLPHLRSRVDYRKQLLDEKSEERKAKLQALIEEKERREAILKELTKTCPYAEKISSENLHDPERLFQATKAFEMAVAELDAMLANPLECRLLKPLNGFESKKIVKDIRFKLMERLTRAGLQSAPYAQAMMIKMSRQGKVHQTSINAPFRVAPIVKHSAAQVARNHQTFIY